MSLPSHQQTEAELESLARREEARRMLQLVLDAIPERVFWKDRDLRYLGCNRRFAEDAGLASPEEIVGLCDFDLPWTREQADAYRNDDRAVIDSGQPRVNYEEPQTSAAGEIWLRTSKVPLQGWDGGCVGVLGTYEDITERKLLEQNLARHRDQLEELVAQRTAELAKVHGRMLEASRHAGMAEVATGVLHNVGNALNSVNVTCAVLGEQAETSPASALQSLADLLEENSDPGSFLTSERGKLVVPYLRELAATSLRDQATVREQLQELRKGVDHIRSIISLQQSAASSRALLETCRLEAVVEDALKMNAASLERHRVEVARELSPVAAAVLDRHRLLQILVNLISNAARALDANTGRRRLRVCLRPEGAERAAITVEDNGVGIPPDMLTRIFSFGVTTRDDGNGFGLHTAALAAAELGGSLEAHSDGPGQGAVFTLVVPLHPADGGEGRAED